VLFVVNLAKAPPCSRCDKVVLEARAGDPTSRRQPRDDTEPRRWRGSSRVPRSGGYGSPTYRRDTWSRILVLFDPARREVLLRRSPNAGLWLPAGGHVEPGRGSARLRRSRARRGARTRRRLPPAGAALSHRDRDGWCDGRHTDVSLWYVLRGDATQLPRYDEGEFCGVAWFPLAELPLERADPHLARFAEKLRKRRRLACVGGPSRPAESECRAGRLRPAALRCSTQPRRGGTPRPTVGFVRSRGVRSRTQRLGLRPLRWVGGARRRAALFAIR